MTHNPQEKEHFHCTDVAEFLQLMHHVGDVFEVRSIKCPDRRSSQFRSTVSGYFDDVGKAVEAISEIESREPPAVYITLNPVNRDLLARCANRIQNKAENTSSDSDVVSRRWLFIDIDPKRPAGISATDSEVAHATAVSDAIRVELQSLGWPEPVQGMSGNGRYLMYRIELPNDDASRDLVRDVLQGLAHRHNTEHAEVDCSTFNASRICKVLGTWARKGDSTSERPHRKSWFIHQDKPMGVVPAELLLTVAAWVPAKAPVASITARVGDNVLELASRYLSKMDPSIEGMKGHDKLLVATSAMVRGFDLNDDDAFHLLASEFNQRCVPPWSEREIRHKIREARSKGDRPFGYLLTKGVNAVPSRNDALSRSSIGGVNADSDKRPDDPWLPEVAIDRPNLPAFPVHVLPEPLRSWVAATSEATQTPPDLAGMLSLAFCSGACARRVEVLAGPGWFEPICLYVAVLLEPGNRKSSVFSSAMHPLQEIEREMIESARPAYAKTASDRRMKEKQRDDAEKKAVAKNCEQSRELALRLSEELASEHEPSQPKLIADDVISEEAENLLSRQGGRLVVAGAEGGLFDVMGGRYSKGSPNLDVFLKGHAGDTLRVDRGSRSVLVYKPCLTLAYAVQPEVLRSMASKPSFRGRGLIGRFLYSYPESLLGRRRVNAPPVSIAVSARYEELVRRLAAIPEPIDQSWLLRFDKDAAVQFLDWQREIESALGDYGALQQIGDWGGKLAGATARLAAILHLIEVDQSHPWEVVISRSVIDRAIQLAQWSIPHARAVILGLMGGDNTQIEDADHVRRWLMEKRIEEFSERDAHVHGRSRFDGNRDRLRACLDLLCETNTIRALPIPEMMVGRPPSPRYSVRPDLTDGRESGVIR
ncbi:MAG: YfjI family protein [Planctomycetota bacterium]